MQNWRKTEQALMPLEHQTSSRGEYDLYPAHTLGEGKIKAGFDVLATQIQSQNCVLIDGYGSVFWEDFKARLNNELEKNAIQVSWIDVSKALKSEDKLNTMLASSLGGQDPLFGKRYEGSLLNFFEPEQLEALKPHEGLTIAYGTGSSLLAWDDALLVYVDVPKNEIQYRSRAGSITNLGVTKPDTPKKMYKRFYFVDWVVLNKHKAELLSRIDILVDEQRKDDISFIPGDALRSGLDKLSETVFRVRPWFESGPWGGQWSLNNIPALPKDVPNYAWSFELITPENGLVFESDGYRLECSFDFLMYQAYEKVLGFAAEHFKYEFPVRFNFLDTFDGGNLSIQCHPSPEFIREHFGETFTQDETYYILDAEENSEVYLGVQEDVEADAFRATLEESQREARAINAKDFVNTELSKKHDLFLIPHGTLHSSGKGNLVLEISATPYIFTFKMYDWMRLGMDGLPRPLNLERAFANLDFSRTGQKIKNEHISRQTVVETDDDWQLVHLSTHPDHFYEVYRYEFDTDIQIETQGGVNILSLVEGSSILLKAKNGVTQRFNYVESFVVPAAAENYTVTNEGRGRARLIVVRLKDNYEYK